jgi:hypothetical protein
MEDKNKEDPLWWAERISEVGIVAGGAAALEHRLNYGRWYDKDKPICHGEIGIVVFAISSIVRIGCAIARAMRPVCPYCGRALTYVPQEQSNYCNNCQIYIGK